MQEHVFLTKKGFDDLEKRLEFLKVSKRKEVAEKIKIAREFGDISENAEYDAAKEEQAQVEGEILEIEQKLRTASIIKEDTSDKSVVIMGGNAILRKEGAVKDIEYSIVGTTEADPTKNKISNESPVGRAIIGKKEGDEVEVVTPSGIIKYTIIKIR